MAVFGSFWYPLQPWAAAELLCQARQRRPTSPACSTRTNRDGSDNSLQICQAESEATADPVGGNLPASHGLVEGLDREAEVPCGDRRCDVGFGSFHCREGATWGHRRLAAGSDIDNG